MSCVAPEVITNNGNGLVGNFTFPCPQLPDPSTYNIPTYNLMIEFFNTLGETYQIINGVELGIPKVAARFGIVLFGQNLNFNDSVAATGYRVRNTATTLILETVPRIIFSDVVRWTLTLSGETLSARLDIVRDNIGAPTPQPPVITPGCPTVFGEVLPTHDGKEICQSNFIVTLYGQPCVNCPSFLGKKQCWISQTREYIFYCTPVVDILRGKGTTLNQKVLSLQRKGLNITVVGAATYGMLRLMLSLLLFGRFDVNFLRQRYYQEFITRLRKSDFCAYASIFEESPYHNYFLH